MASHVTLVASGLAEWAQGDPSGLSSPLGQLTFAASFLAVIVLALRWWWNQRR